MPGLLRTTSDTDNSADNDHETQTLIINEGKEHLQKEPISKIKHECVEEIDDNDSINDNSKSQDQDEDYNKLRLRYLVTKTVVLGLLWMSWGAFSSLWVTTIVDIRIRVGANYEELSRAMASGTIGTVLGAPLGGIVSERWVQARDMHIVVFSIIQVLTVAIRPWLHTLWLLAVMIVLESVVANFFSNGMNNMFDRLWGRHVGFPRQMMSVCWTVGELIAPLICWPFFLHSEPAKTDAAPLQGVPVQSYQGNTTALSTNDTSAMNTSSIIKNMTLTNPSESPLNVTNEAEVSSPIEYPYLILTAFITIPLVAICILYYFDRTSGEKYYAKSALDDLTLSGAKKQYQVTSLRQIFSFKRCGQGSSTFGAVFYVLIAMYYFTFCFMSSPFWQFIMAYAVDTIGLTKAEASMLLIAQKITYVISGIIWAIIMHYVPVQILIFVQIAAQLGITIYFNIIDIYTSTQLYWFVCSFATFTAPTWSIGITWGLRYVEFTSMTYSANHMACSLASMFATWASGYVIEYGGHQALLRLQMAGMVAFCLTVIIMQVVASCKGEKYNNLPHYKTEMKDLSREPLLSDEDDESEEVIFDAR